MAGEPFATSNSALKGPTAARPIASIIDLMERMALQINLLALNATIETERAVIPGEALRCGPGS